MKLIDSVSSFSDYDLQVSLIETVFRLYGRNLINKKLTDLIPESQELSQSFGEIHPDTFDEDARSFLNALNKSSQRICSIVCSTVYIDNIKCKPPMVSDNKHLIAIIKSFSVFSRHKTNCNSTITLSICSCFC